MNCKKFQEVILTDYADDQLNEADRNEISNHLMICKSCREFDQVTKKLTLEPFLDSKTSQPPEILWEHIKKTVEPKLKDPVFNPFFETLLHRLSLPRSIFALSSVLTIFLIALVLFRSPQFFKNLENQQLSHAYLEEQVEYFSGSTQSDDSTNLNAAIENYLL